MRGNPQAVARLTELHRYADEADEVFCRSRVECGLEAAAEHQSEVCSRIEALTARIRALPATTFQGLAVKALHLTFDTSLWDMNDPDEWIGISTAFAFSRRRCCGICRMTYAASV